MPKKYNAECKTNIILNPLLCPLHSERQKDFDQHSAFV